MKSFQEFFAEDLHIPKDEIGSYAKKNDEDKDKNYFYATGGNRTVVVDRQGRIADGENKGQSLKTYSKEVIKGYQEKEQREKSTRDDFIDELKKTVKNSNVEIKGKQIILNIDAGGDRQKRLELAKELCQKFGLSIQDGKTKSGVIKNSGGYNLEINDTSKTTNGKVSGSAATQFNIKTHYLSTKLDNGSSEPWNTGSTSEIASEVEKSFKTSDLPQETKKSVLNTLSLVTNDISDISEEDFAKKYHECMKSATKTGLMSSANEVLYPAVILAAKNAKNKTQASKNIRKVLGDKNLSRLFKCKPEEVESYLTDSSLEVSFPKDQNNGTYDFQISVNERSTMAFGENRSRSEIKQAVRRCIGVSVKHGAGVGTNINHLIDNYSNLGADRRKEIEKSSPVVSSIFSVLSDKSNKEPKPITLTKTVLNLLQHDIEEKTGKKFDVDKFISLVKSHKTSNVINPSSDFEEFEQIINAYSKKNSMFSSEGFPTSIYYNCMKYACSTINSSNNEKNALADVFKIPDVVQLSSTNDGGMSIFDLSDVRADVFKVATKTTKAVFSSKYVPLTLVMGSKSITEFIK